MKYYPILFLFLFQYALSQSYYPLTTGNEWFYDSSATPYKIKVVSDSLFANGKTYFALNRTDFVYGKYIRTDSHFVYYYDLNNSLDVPVFKLDGKIGDTTKFSNYFNAFSYAIISKIDSITIFGKSTRVISYKLDGIQLREVTLSDKFGPLSASLYSDPPPPWPDYVFNAVGCIINGTKYGYTLSVKPIISVPQDFILYQNYPNPFNPTTTIEFVLPTANYVELQIIDYLGRESAVLVSENLSAGTHQVRWNANNMASGIYFYRLRVGNKSEIKKLVLSR